jgi:hypothetical protein
MFKAIRPDTTRELIAFRPLDHPDFGHCADPRVIAGHAHPVVYVPNLVYMLHKMGGPFNVSDVFGEPTSLEVGHNNATVVEAVIPGGIDADGGFNLHLSEWHRSKSEHLLTIIFDVPAKWHLGEWEVEVVMREDMFSSTAALDREIAELCDSTIGQELADNSALS